MTKTQSDNKKELSKVFDARGNGEGYISPTLTGDHQSRITDYTAIVVEVKETPILLESNQNHATAKETETCTTLPASMGMGGGYVPMVVDQRGEGMKQEPICFLDDVRLETDENGTAFALHQRDHKGVQCVCDNAKESPEEGKKGQALSIGNGQMCNITMKPVANTLDCMHDQQAVIKSESGELGESIVRRLTPTECARLQGFPDGWVNIGEWTDTKGKRHADADTPKYKAYGNSIAVGFANDRSGFWCWLMRRIAAQYERKATQGSLFSGIGGFDLAWAAVNGPESVRWSSEIEEFPIAVIKKHFGDEDAGIKGDFYEAINGG